MYNGSLITNLSYYSIFFDFDGIDDAFIHKKDNILTVLLLISEKRQHGSS